MSCVDCVSLIFWATFQHILSFGTKVPTRTFEMGLTVLYTSLWLESFEYKLSCTFCGLVACWDWPSGSSVEVGPSEDLSFGVFCKIDGGLSSSEPVVFCAWNLRKHDEILQILVRRWKRSGIRRRTASCSTIHASEIPPTDHESQAMVESNLAANKYRLVNHFFCISIQKWISGHERKNYKA